MCGLPSPDQDKEKDFKAFVNPNSLQEISAFVEPGLSEAKKGDLFQFQRLGYFVLDQDSTAQQLVFNKTVGLRDTWEKQNQ